MKIRAFFLSAMLLLNGATLFAQETTETAANETNAAATRTVPQPRYVDWPRNSVGVAAGLTKLFRLTDGPAPLFGENLENADFPEGSWVLDDQKELCAKTDAVLWTKEKYSAFLCHFEFNLSEGANGGFLFQCSNKEDWIPNTLEIQLLDDAGQEPNYHSCGAFYGFQAPYENATKKPGEWNAMDIVCEGRLVSVVLNGKLVNRIDTAEWFDPAVGPDGTEIEEKFRGRTLASFEPYGYIGFQGLHGAAPIRIRNAVFTPIRNADTTREGWRPFFGDALENADYDPDVWSLDENGILRANKDEMIWGKDEYKNFFLDFEFRTTKDANSGVVIQATNRELWIPNSFEIQIYDSFGKDADLGSCGAVYGRRAPDFNVCKAPGEWNHMTISVLGPDIYVVLNDQLTTHMLKSQWKKADENPDGSKPFSWLINKAPAETPTVGSVGFQGLHEKAPVEYRNIMIWGKPAPKP